MPKGYRPYLPDQDLLLPPSLREWVAEEHLVYFVSDVVDQLDLSAIHAVYGEEKRGQPPYDPRLMTKLLVSARIQYGSQDGSGFELAPAHRRAEQRQQQACAKRGAGTTVSLSKHGQLEHATVKGS
jgi:hypothetical protein